MNRFALTGILVLVVISTSLAAWAGTTTEGLTSVSVAVTGDATTGFDYTLTVFNNSVDGFSAWDVLVGQLNIYNVVAGVKPNLLAPSSVLSPVGWTWDLNGNGWKTNSVISYDPISNGVMYWSPPSIAPGGSLTGFVLHYDSPYDISVLDFQTHVFAVQPLSGPAAVPQYYQPTAAYLNSNVYASNVNGLENTWWDRPTVEGGECPNEPRVPEASAAMLGFAGLLGPVGYALRKRKVA